MTTAWTGRTNSACARYLLQPTGVIGIKALGLRQVQGKDLPGDSHLGTLSGKASDVCPK